MMKSKITVAVVAALALCYGTTAFAQTAPQDTTQQNTDQTPDTAKAKKLAAVTVTGSLIPQTQIETAQPVITITAEDMKARGFATIAEALQQSSFATGSVQGSQFTNSFTPAAQTLSMFGLPVGFVKYLIDGRPMGNFPGLYNGSDTFNNLSGIPMDMVDHIDVLPGGQSSLYGSDAIAGVINIVLKKHIDAPVVDARFGWHSDGGGASRRLSFADSFNIGKFNSLDGFQFDSSQPIWKHDRSLTSQFYNQGTTPQTASRDYLVTGYYTGYHFEDPANCANVSGQWGGTEKMQHRAGLGDYCGSVYTPGAGTLTTGSKSANLYSHNTFDVSDNLQLYGDLLYNYQEQKYTNGSSTTFWNTGFVDGYYWDPNIGDFMLAQHAFSPEEVGGYEHIMNKETENSYMLTLGAKGTFGSSNWDYDLGFTHSDDKLLDHDFQRFTDPMEAYFAKIMGPQMSTMYGYPQFTPHYDQLYMPVSNADFRSFTGYTDSNSKTWDNMLRGQLTNASLFSLPGGDAGMAVVLEGGNQGWDSSPDPRLLETTTVNGIEVPFVWGTSATPGRGHRSRYAATTELKFPLLSQLTLDVSGRYDSYDVSGTKVSHPTYNLGLEYRPFESLLLRGRYGTAFKVPTLSDEFQLPSGFYSSVIDYLNCGRQGHGGADIDNCQAPYSSVQYNGLTYGNPDLKPITAKVWSYGLVWAPMERMSVTVDYLHWDIQNEVASVSADQLSQTEYLCDIGTIDPGSATCAQAFTLITRGPGVGQYLGKIETIATPKLNVADEQVNAITASFNYIQDIGSLGRLSLALSYSDLLKHSYQDYPTDPAVDLLRHPNYSTDFKSKENGSLTWSKDQWSSTIYVNRFGRSPNYAATVADNYTDPNTGKLGAWTLYNFSVTYNPLKNLGLSFQVENVFNKMPPADHTYLGTTGTPYDIFNYNVFGRSMFIEANYKFGDTK